MNQDDIIDYEQWYALNEERIYIELAESGADRELDYDPEREFENRYDAFVELSKQMTGDVDLPF